MSYLRKIKDPFAFITPIEYGITFPEKLSLMKAKYQDAINNFKDLVISSSSSSELLEKIRSSDIAGKKRMALLKIFRRCVSLVCDTELTKKIKKVSTETLIRKYGKTFKPIDRLKEEFRKLSKDQMAALALLIGEYDERGQLGYALTDIFFSWFEENFPEFKMAIISLTKLISCIILMDKGD
jgi:hypothetical protein